MTNNNKLSTNRGFPLGFFKCLGFEPGGDIAPFFCPCDAEGGEKPEGGGGGEGGRGKIEKKKKRRNKDKVRGYIIGRGKRSNRPSFIL